MKNWMLALAAGCVATSASGQFEIRHQSDVLVSYLDLATEEQEIISDSITTATPSGNLLPLQSHSVSYVHPGLGYDPSASSAFSVDSFEVIGAGPGTSHLVRYGMSGNLSRSGPGRNTQGTPLLFGEAEATQVIDIDVEPIIPGGNVTYFQYSLSVDYTSDQVAFGSDSVFNMYAVLNSGATIELESLALSDGNSSVSLNVVNQVAWSDDVDYIRIEATPQHLGILIPLEGTNELSYELSFITFVQEIPAPTTLAAPAMAGLLLARRRRGR